MYKIGIIENIHPSGIELLNNNSNFEYDIITDISEENLRSKIEKYDAVSLRVSILTENVLSYAKNLKVISRHGVGYDNVPINYLKKNNITLMITGTANAVAVSEHVFYMMLSLSKSLLYLDTEVRSGNFKSNIKNFQTFELQNKEILIAGFGRIGKNLIKKCIGFDMIPKVYDPFVNEQEIQKLGGHKVNNFIEGVKSADFLTIHMPLNKETNNIINYELLRCMKKNSIIINTARGGIINEVDLNKALNENIIFGAGLDVFEKEPPDLNNPLLKNKKVIMTPHTAALTNECKIRMSKETIQNIINFFENKINKNMIVKL
jgi:D-3-phosphoglycerate dehydrogenase